MSASRAELSTIATGLEELTRRVAELADQAAAHADDDPMASDLFALERALRGACRRIERLARSAPATS
ncbi:MAG: hypothetical protein ACYCUF_05380 [Acidimicrobiales bacterium]|nr:hypothetical protein [Actinomycetota bacterium]MDA8184527.1 hypothetical protein [Actinomycetota bacterium]